MSLNGEFLDKDHLQYFWQQIKLKFATAAQGTKADSAVQTIKINSTTQTKTDGVVDLPAYPTKSSLGLGNVDNTSDLNKPISTAVAASQAAQDAEIAVIANAGAKNLLEITAATQTINGVTFTVNADQTITVNGTNTESATALFTINDLEIPAGESYTLTGCPAGGSNSTFYLGSLNTTNWQEYILDTGNGGTKALQTTLTIRFRIGVRPGVTANNLVFKPMLRPALITDSTFVPYAPTNRELYEMIQALQNNS
jgi:hypothetical protein